MMALPFLCDFSIIGTVHALCTRMADEVGRTSCTFRVVVTWFSIELYQTQPVHFSGSSALVLCYFLGKFNH